VCFAEKIKSGLHEDFMLGILKAPPTNHALTITPELLDLTIRSSDHSVARYVFSAGSGLRLRLTNFRLNFRLNVMSGTCSTKPTCPTC
jgi:hypothetical protein